MQKKVKIIRYSKKGGGGKRDSFGIIHMKKNGKKFTVDLFLREFGPSLTGKSEEADFRNMKQGERHKKNGVRGRTSCHFFLLAFTLYTHFPYSYSYAFVWGKCWDWEVIHENEAA